MSLLLDALRRASANREDAKAGHYTVPRRMAAPEAHGAQSPEPGPEAAVDPSDELSLAPRGDPTGAGDSPAHSDAVADSRDTGAGEQVEPSPDAAGLERPDPSVSSSAPTPRERETADTLLTAGASGRGSRLPLVLGLSAAGVVAVASLGSGGWLWYQQSREQVRTDLGAFQPSAARVEPAAEPAATDSREELAFDEDAAGLTLADADAVAESAESAGSSEPQGEPDGTGLMPDEAGEVEPASDGADTAKQSAGATGAREANEPTPSTSDSSGAEPAATGQPDANGDGANASTAEQPKPDPPSSAGRSSETDARATSADGEAAEHRAVSEGSGQSGAANTRAPEDPGAGDSARRARPLVQMARGAPLAEALDIGYRSLGEGNLAAAEAAYGRALRLEPENRDALLGAAVVHQRQGSPAAARRMYQRVLDAHPRDPYARAALTALDGGTPRRDETELKMLLRDQPDSPALLFALGNLYAAESRWSDARQAYMRASEAAPRDPDYAFNLAVALDHLGRRQAAREHYQRALRLAAGIAPEFEPAVARRRLEQLR